ncbi:kinetochore protein spc25-related [Anaeramoeba flamelloides]|uniref:Kinetochore protein SPC25 n=1 Tax=Anaeramoeba flamelloides TaxID=1746091 RepID=A0AAV7ZSS1_9EUKA|nr:kinetochore protein spc25-related [Anaeramoeba flamelloides]
MINSFMTSIDPQKQIEEIRNSISKSEQQFDNWVREESQKIENLKKEGMSLPKEGKKKIQQLKKQEEELKIEKKSINKENKEIQQTKEEINKLTKTKTEKLKQNIELNENIQKQRTILQERKIVIQNKEQIQQLKEKELQDTLDKYQTWLGLNFKRMNGNKLRIILTQIDPQDHSREFYFTVRIDRTSRYIVEECDPILPSLKELVNNLNKTNDFSLFVRKMRKKFKETC